MPLLEEHWERLPVLLRNTQSVYQLLFNTKGKSMDYAGSFVSGLAGGLSKGLETSYYRKMQEVNARIEKLKALQTERKINMEEQKLLADQNAKSFETFNKWLGASNKMAPTQQDVYLSHLDQMPFFQKNPNLQPIFKSMASASSESRKEFAQIIKSFEDAKLKNDQDGMYQAYFDLMARMDPSDTKANAVLEMLGTQLGIKGTSKTEVGRLLAESRQYEPGSREAQLYEQRLSKLTQPSAGINIYTGEIEKGTKKDLEQRAWALSGYIDQVKRIKKSLDTDIMKFGQQASHIVNIAKDKLLYGRLSGKDERQLTEYEDAMARITGVFNELLSNTSGKTITAKEESRLRAQYPILYSGVEGIIKNPSPLQLKQKLDTFLDISERSLQRYQKALKEGQVVFDETGMPQQFLDKNGTPMELEEETVQSAAERKRDIARTLILQNPDIANQPEILKQQVNEIYNATY